MKNYKTIFIFLVILTILMLTGCGCEHQWVEGTCDAPEICSLCGKTQGVATEHYFREATCELPKTCVKCGLTEGEPNGHDFDDATCTTAQKCKNCTKVQGTKLGHDYDYGVCTRCYEVDENFRDYDNYGFYNMYGMNIWVPVTAYNLSENYVEVPMSNYSYLEFSDNYFKSFWTNPTELTEESGLIVNDNFNVTTYNYIDNDVIEYNGASGMGPWAITERVVAGDKLIIKTQDETRLGNSEKWYVPADLLDLDSVVDSGEKGYYHIYFK